MRGIEQPEAPAARSAGTVEIEYFTDPLCSWSWGFEPQWRRVRFEFGAQLRWRYRMGGMIPDWNTYSDPLNSVNRPAQMAPQWIEVHHLSGMPFEPRLWIEDPPQSSYLPCIAFKAVESQWPELAEIFLRRLREAVMMNGRNISRRDVLESLAGQLGEIDPRFDYSRFAHDFDHAATELFREDMKLASYRGIGRFPTLLIRKPGAHGVVLVGYRPYAMLRAALAQAAPEIKPVRTFTTPEAYGDFWGGVTNRELAEWLSRDGQLNRAK